MTLVQRNPHRRNLAAMQFELSKPPYIPPGSQIGRRKRSNLRAHGNIILLRGGAR
jgi:hypothetical protein